MKCIWYISKYVSPSTTAPVGNRGYFIMRELSKMGHCCLIITSNSNIFCSSPQLTSHVFHEFLEGVHVYWIKILKYKTSKSLKRIISWLHFEWRLFLMPKYHLNRPDVVIVSSPSLLTVLNGLILKKRFGCRMIFEVRDIWPLTLVEEGSFSKKNPFILFLGWIEKLGYKKADTIVGTMPNLVSHVEKILGYKKYTPYIPMGFPDEILFRPLPVSKKYLDFFDSNNIKNKFSVIYAGTIGITNALEIFFKCASSLSHNKDIHFLIMGEGYLLESYKKKYGNLKNILFLPQAPKNMVHSILSKCDLLYFSTYKSELWKYGQSLNKIIDYMLAGRPILASYTGFQSMINEAGCGTFVPAGDMNALLQAILDYSKMPKGERDSIGARGREWVISHRRYGNLAQQYLGLIDPNLPPKNGTSGD